MSLVHFIISKKTQQAFLTQGLQSLVEGLQHSETDYFYSYCLFASKTYRSMKYH